MPRVVPSQVREFIEREFFDGRRPADSDAVNLVLFAKDHAAKLRAVLDLVAEIPQELITLSQEQYSDFVQSRSVLQHTLERWLTGQDMEGLKVRKQGQVHPLVMLHRTLGECADEAVPVNTPDLTFIADSETRESLRQDVGMARSAFANGEWKASAVIAGSVVEALLLWGLQEKYQEAQVAAALPSLTTATGKKLQARGHTPGQPIKPLLVDQALEWYKQVSGKLGLVSAMALIQIDLAQDFRNLIHPGREKKEGRCTRGRALAAMAALELVLEEFEAKFATQKQGWLAPE